MVGSVWVIKDNLGRYVCEDSFDTLEDDEYCYISFHVFANSIYMGCKSKERAIKSLEKLNKDKFKCGFDMLEFHIVEAKWRDIIAEMTSFKGRNTIIAKRIVETNSIKDMIRIG